MGHFLYGKSDGPRKAAPSGHNTRSNMCYIQKILIRGWGLGRTGISEPLRTTAKGTWLRAARGRAPVSRSNKFLFKKKKVLIIKVIRIGRDSVWNHRSMKSFERDYYYFYLQTRGLKAQKKVVIIISRLILIY